MVKIIDYKEVSMQFITGESHIMNNGNVFLTRVQADTDGDPARWANSLVNQYRNGTMNPSLNVLECWPSASVLNLKVQGVGFYTISEWEKIIDDLLLAII